MTKPSLADESFDAVDGTDARIRLAEAAIGKLKASFAEWVKADIDSIGVHLAAAESTSCDKTRLDQFEAVRQIAHNIKGQGGTFGCHDLSAAAGELDAFIKRRGGAGDIPATRDLAAKLRRAFARELA